MIDGVACPLVKKKVAVWGGGRPPPYREIIIGVPGMVTADWESGSPRDGD